MSNQPAPSKQLANRPPQRDIRTLLASEDIRARVAEIIPKYLTAESVTRVMLATISRVPKLAGCSQESLLNALMTCAQAGLPPDGRHAHLIPYGTECQVIFDYKGLLKLARDNGIKGVCATVVCENDEFEFERINGTPVVRHTINYRAPRGAMFLVFGTYFDAGQLQVEVMTKEQVDAIRRRSRAAQSGPWVTDYEEMARKTVIRRMSKMWPLSAELAAAIDSEDDNAADIQKVTKVRETVKPAFIDAPVIEDQQQATTDPGRSEEPTGEWPEGQPEGNPANPPAPPVEKPAAKKAERAPNPIAVLRDNMKAKGIDDAELLKWLRQNDQGIHNSVISMPADLILKLNAEWDEFAAQIKGA